MRIMGHFVIVKRDIVFLFFFKFESYRNIPRISWKRGIKIPTFFKIECQRNLVINNSLSRKRNTLATLNVTATFNEQWTVMENMVHRETARGRPERRWTQEIRTISGTRVHESGDEARDLEAVWLTSMTAAFCKKTWFMTTKSRNHPRQINQGS